MKYEFLSNNIELLLNEKLLSSDKKTTIKDNKDQIFKLDSFQYSIKNEELKGKNITYITNFSLPESDKLFFSSAFINLKNQNAVGKDLKFDFHNNLFGNKKNSPRLRGVSSVKKDNLLTINKGIFTSCGVNENCPPWSLKAEKITHNKEKKQLIYDDALLRIYDVPILYFPKFFHPDPTVKRQTGLLAPQVNNSNILGNSITVPYYFAYSGDKDFTFTPSIFDKNIQMLQTEYRQVNKKSNLITDFGFVRGYKSSVQNKKENINHLFGKFNLNLDLTNFNSSDLNVNIEKVSSDTYLKVFENNLATKYLKPKNFNVLENNINVVLDHEKFDFTTGFKSFEDLQKKDSDRYQFVFPYYNYSSILNENILNGFISLDSTGSNNLKDTNNLRTKVINDLSYKGYDLNLNNGITNNLNINLKNLNSLGKKDNEYKSSPQSELVGDIELQTRLPLIKVTETFNNYLTPKMSFRFSPNDMKNHTNTDRKIDASNIFANNRLGLEDSLEGGESLTVGLDYKKENLKDINKFVEMKLATVFRTDEERFIPKTTTLNEKNSNIFGQISNNLSKNLNFTYNFAFDNSKDTFEYNNLNTTISINNFVTKFNFIEESGSMGSKNTLENSVAYEFNENNFLSFKTRRNRKINLTEYYDLVYEYKIDCLTAGLKYNKTYYEDRDLKQTENIYFTLSIIPLTTYEQKVSK